MKAFTQSPTNSKGPFHVFILQTHNLTLKCSLTVNTPGIFSSSGDRLGKNYKNQSSSL